METKMSHFDLSSIKNYINVKVRFNSSSGAPYNINEGAVMECEIHKFKIGDGYQIYSNMAKGGLLQEPFHARQYPATNLWPQ